MNLKCLSCGGPVVFDVESGKMKCIQCGQIQRRAFALKSDGEQETDHEVSDGAFAGDPFYDAAEGARNNGKGMKLSDKVVDTEEKEDKVDFHNLWFGLKPGQKWRGESLNSSVKPEREIENTGIGMEGFEEFREHQEDDDENTVPLNQKVMDVNVYHCTSCGARLTINGVEASSFCSFCGQPTIVFDRVSREAQPDYVIPFQVTKDNAMKRIREHFRKGTYIPKEIKELKIDKIRGIYIPCWLYSATMRKKANLTEPENDRRRRSFSTDTIKRGMYPGSFSSQSVTAQDYMRMAQGTNKFHVDLSCTYQNVYADASKKLDDSLAQRLGPYDMKGIVPFDISYLSGYYADMYDVSSRDVAPLVHKFVDDYTNEKVKSCCMKPSARIEKSIEQYMVNDISYALLPAWFMTFWYENELYTVLVNGQTGKVVGNVPFDTHRAIAYTAALGMFSCMIAIFITITLGKLANEGESRLLFYFLAVCIGFGLSGMEKMRRYLKNKDRFKSGIIVQYVKGRQDKTWVR